MVPSKEDLWITSFPNNDDKGYWIGSLREEVDRLWDLDGADLLEEVHEQHLLISHTLAQSLASPLPSPWPASSKTRDGDRGPDGSDLEVEACPACHDRTKPFCDFEDCRRCFSPPQIWENKIHRIKEALLLLLCWCCCGCCSSCCWCR